MPDIIERLRGTAVRLEAEVGQLGEAVLCQRDHADAWSIKENIGHLGILDPLWKGRVEDMLNGLEMREADLANRETKDSGFDSHKIEELHGHISRASK